MSKAAGQSHVHRQPIAADTRPVSLATTAVTPLSIHNLTHYLSGGGGPLRGSAGGPRGGPRLGGGIVSLPR